MSRVRRICRDLIDKLDDIAVEICEVERLIGEELDTDEHIRAIQNILDDVGLEDEDDRDVF